MRTYYFGKIGIRKKNPIHKINLDRIKTKKNRS